MKLNKPVFWDRKIGFLSIVLYPLTLIYLVLIYIKKKFTKEQEFKFPIICVGNIYIGGTGKTPISIFLANEITKLGKKPVIIRKYYESHKDEHDLIKDKFKDLILKRDRIDALIEAEKSDFNTVILDDGLQDYRIKKNLSIVCFNSNQLIGNGMMLPSGPLRESLNTLKKTDIVIINGKKNKKFEDKILNINSKIKVFNSSYIPINLEEFKNKKLYALAGIGNPENFFQLIETNNLIIEKKIVFPDHYKIPKNKILAILDDAEKNDCQLIMTEKDYFKVKDYNISKINYLKVSLNIEHNDKLLKIINNHYEKNF